MSDPIKVALITLAGVLTTAIASIITQVVLAKRSQAQTVAEIQHQSELNDQKLDAKLEKHQAVTDIKIDELTREVRKHNGFAERVPVLEEQIKVANHRIEDLERKENRG